MFTNDVILKLFKSIIGINFNYDYLLEKINEYGEIPHEEIIGDYSNLKHFMNNNFKKLENNDPIYDYDQIDQNFLFPIILTKFLLESPDDITIKTFFYNPINLEKIILNIQYVLSVTSQYANNRVVTNLIHLKKGKNVGNWRDSEYGLGSFNLIIRWRDISF
jgi:hypothetical protein